MDTVAHVSPSPELTQAVDLINRGCAEIQKILAPVDGRVPRANKKAALHFLEDVLKADKAVDRADYAEVERLMGWAAAEVSV